MHTCMRFEAALDADGETVHISRTMGDDGHVVTAADLARIGWVYLSDSFPSNRETQHEIVDELLETVQLEQEEAVFEAVADQYARLLHSSPALLALRKRIADALTSALPMRCNPNNLMFVPGSKLQPQPVQRRAPAIAHARQAAWPMGAIGRLAVDLHRCLV